MTKRHYFGTDGIRGEVGGDVINPEFLLYLGWAAGTVFSNNQTEAKVLIGKDTRHSCDVLEASLAAGLMAAGVDVVLLGVLPTPAIAHFTHSLQATAGAVISASHNGYQDNGVKFFANTGRKLDDWLEIEIEQQLAKPIHIEPGLPLGRFATIADVEGRYIEFCKETFPRHQNLKDIKIVIDCANGATYKLAPQVFMELGAEVNVIGNQPDGYNINLNCGSTHLLALQKAVLAAEAHIGLAFDGDGDRLLMVDHEGETIDGDEILCILACYHENSIKELSGVVGTAMSNLGLELALAQEGIQFERTAVGDRYVLERMLQKGWFLGGESSGHIVNLQHTTTGDGIITALQILAVMQRTGMPLHDLRQVMFKRPQVLINVPIKQRIDVHAEPNISQALAHAEAQLREKGRVLLRASGTEPVIRVMVEGDDERQVHKIAQLLAQQVALAAQ